MDDKTYCVYMHKNKTNNKVYIGITGNNPESRWKNGNGYKYNTHFWRAINKYGWNEGFEHIILEENLTKSEAEQKEIELIKKYQSTNQNKGYNMQKGGNLGSSKTVYQYDRYTGELLRIWDNTIGIEKALGIPNTNVSFVCLGGMKTAGGYYFSYSDLGDKLSEDILCWINTNDSCVKIAQYDLNGNFVKLYDKSTNASNELGFDTSRINFNNKTSFGYIWVKIKDEHIDYKQPLSKEELQKHLTSTINNKECYQYDSCGRFVASYISTTEAALKTNINQSCIAAVCRGDFSKSGGFYWKYASDVEYGVDLSEEEVKKLNTSKNSKKVCEYDLQGNLLRIWDSITDAANYYGLSTSNISAACKGKIRKTNNSIWRYLNDEVTQEDIDSVNVNNRKRKVCQFDMNGRYITTYNSLASASRVTGVSNSSITQCCNRVYKHAAQFIWRYEGDVVTEEDLIFSNSDSRLNKKIKQVDEKENVIMIYDSVAKAGKAIGISPSAITACCKGKQKTSGGFKWEYVE